MKGGCAPLRSGTASGIFMFFFRLLVASAVVTPIATSPLRSGALALLALRLCCILACACRCAARGETSLLSLPLLLMPTLQASALMRTLAATRRVKTLPTASAPSCTTAASSGHGSPKVGQRRHFTKPGDSCRVLGGMR